MVRGSKDSVAARTASGQDFMGNNFLRLARIAENRFQVSGVRGWMTLDGRQRTGGGGKEIRRHAGEKVGG